jgi:hypothetical protein
MGSIDVGPKTRPSKSCGKAHPERRSFPVVPTLIGAIAVANVASVVLTLIQ